MNLHTAKSELKAHGPRVGAGVLAIETLVIFSTSFLLVSLFT